MRDEWGEMLMKEEICGLVRGGTGYEEVECEKVRGWGGEVCFGRRGEGGGVGGGVG